MNGSALRLIAGIFLLIGLPSAHAIKVIDADSYPSPPTGLPLSNLGQHGTSSAIFVGDIAGNGTYWALTASHISPGTFIFNGVTYYVPETSRLQIKNEIGVGYPNTDLILAQLNITNLPTGLANLEIASILPTETETTYLVGRGGDARWGTTHANYQDEAGIRLFLADLEATTSVVYITQTDTSEPGLPQTGGWGVRFDSGGGHFFQQGSDWYLSGILLAAETQGTNHQTIMAALPYYRDEILRLTAIPEPSSLLLLTLGLLPLLRGGGRRSI